MTVPIQHDERSARTGWLLVFPDAQRRVPVDERTNGASDPPEPTWFRLLLEKLGVKFPPPPPPPEEEDSGGDRVMVLTLRRNDGSEITYRATILDPAGFGRLERG